MNAGIKYLKKARKAIAKMSSEEYNRFHERAMADIEVLKASGEYQETYIPNKGIEDWREFKWHLENIGGLAIIVFLFGYGKYGEPLECVTSGGG